MVENKLAKNIIYYRKKKGLSQEKVAEYIGVSRQAVTKWESNISRPSSDNLIKLARLFEVSVDTLLNNSAQTKISMGKMPWIFIGISVFCIGIYVIKSNLSNTFSIGTLICMFTLCVPIQLFLHIYFSNAINTDSFDGIAGFDNKIEYNIDELKKMLMQINLHIGILSTVYTFLLCIDLNIEWLNYFLIITYALNFAISIEIINYKMIDKIYCKEEDKKRAERSMPIIIIYTLFLFIGMGMLIIIFEIKGIENNTIPAIKIAGLLVLSTATATIGFILENNQIKKWDPANTNYKPSKASIIILFACVILYGSILCTIF